MVHTATTPDRRWSHHDGAGTTHGADWGWATVADGVTDERFSEMERSLAALNQQFSEFRTWCLEQVTVRETKITRLERANTRAHAELSRLRTIISSVGVIAQQAHPPEDEPDEDDLGE